MKSLSDYSNESYWAPLSRGIVYYAVQGYSKFESVILTLKESVDEVLDRQKSRE